VTRQVVLLRGVNLVRTNRVPMQKLREALEADGFADVKTYVQSGNIVVTSKASPDRVGARVRALIKKKFGHDIAVVVRSHAELTRVVKRNPLGKVARNPKRYLVTFLSTQLPAEIKKRLREVAGPDERFAVSGREIYSWHPEGVGRSPLWERLAAKGLGVTATSRNWSTVTTLLAMSEEAKAR
jgi:uncharacterized protein (DUF1697 family)